MTDFDVASSMDLPVPDTIEEAVRQRNHWINCAAQHSRNEEYYRGLVEQIGGMFAPEAYTQDDGNVTEDVLCAKVPEVVRAKLAA